MLQRIFNTIISIQLLFFTFSIYAKSNSDFLILKNLSDFRIYNKYEQKLSAADSLILIEQPEIHLHPKAQSILGDLFIAASNNGKRHFIIETHSEHLLSRVRRRIAEGKIKKEDVIIYYFENTFDGTNIKQLKLNDKGQYNAFPKGFFEEAYDEAVKHLEAL